MRLTLTTVDVPEPACEWTKREHRKYAGCWRYFARNILVPETVPELSLHWMDPFLNYDNQFRKRINLKHAAAFRATMAAALHQEFNNDFANVIEFVVKRSLKQVASLGEGQRWNILTINSVQKISESSFFNICLDSLICSFFESTFEHHLLNVRRKRRDK